MERPEFEGKEGSKVIVEGMGAGTLMFYGLHHVRTTRCVRHTMLSIGAAAKKYREKKKVPPFFTF